MFLSCPPFAHHLPTIQLGFVNETCARWFLFLLGAIWKAFIRVAEEAAELFIVRVEPSGSSAECRCVVQSSVLLCVGHLTSSTSSPYHLPCHLPFTCQLFVSTPVRTMFTDVMGKVGQNLEPDLLSERCECPVFYNDHQTKNIEIWIGPIASYSMRICLISLDWSLAPLPPSEHLWRSLPVEDSSSRQMPKSQFPPIAPCSSPIQCWNRPDHQLRLKPFSCSKTTDATTLFKISQACKVW